MTPAARLPSLVDPNQTLEEAQSLLSFLHESISASEKKYRASDADVRGDSNRNPAHNVAGESDPCSAEAGEGEEQDLSEEELARLLEELEVADIVAQGVEGRLDGLLDSLEGMLGGLEEGQANGTETPEVTQGDKEQSNAARSPTGDKI